MIIQVAERGLPPDEIQMRIQAGWIVVPNVLMAGATIVVPGQSPAQSKRVDLWILPDPGPTMPQISVVDVLITVLEEEGTDEPTLDIIAKLLFGAPIRQVQQKWTEMRQAMAATVETEGPVQ